MPALRYLSLVALAFWIGGLAALAVVAAPVLFDVLPAHDPDTGRTLAGMAFGAIFESFERIALVPGAIVAATLAWRAARPARPRGLVWRSAVLAAMLALTVVTGAVIGPRIDALRVSTPTPIADLPDGNAVKTEFGRLHGLSGGLMIVVLAGGLALMWMEMSDR
jgi:hypothetical protein